ncbi:MAG: hypothetical protein M4579_000209 [Chaenotheca gracillima]|nr:MAG: hypothetical protein M4579_000209 [Chaenotheca gracillima]
MPGRRLSHDGQVSNVDLLPVQDVAICFDPVEQKLFTDFQKKVDGAENLYTKVKLPRRDSSVDCFVTERKTEQQIFVGTVNLKKLGYKINRRRKLGKIENIYILGTV